MNNHISRDRQDFLEPIDVHFGRFIERIGGGFAPWLFLTAALVSRSAREGDVCLDISNWAGTSVPGEAAGILRECPELATWRNLLEGNSVVGKPGDYRPLILDGQSRLYLFRYWEHETDLAEVLLRKAAETSWKERFRQMVSDTKRLQEGLNRLFPRSADGHGKVREGGPDWQKIAALAAILQNLTVISGAPGTGKTATAAKAIILLLEQARGRKLRIALTAPTGKAAARLQEVVARTRDQWCPDQQIREAMPDRATTIHRLLGSLPHSSRFRHHRDNPLSVDVVVVDEASMVDLPLLTKLVQALPEKSRLILLGDRNQLASVEAGAVISDICGGKPLNCFSREFADCLASLMGESPAASPSPEGTSAIGDCLIELQTNYRFDEAGGIHRISQAVNQGRGNAALDILKEGNADVRWAPVPSFRELPERLKKIAINYFKSYLNLIDTKGEYNKIFDLFGRFRILCALRQGPYGVEEINRLFEKILREAGLICTSGPWYPGRPVMITRNDYGMRLFNGDVGLILPDPGQKGKWSACFRESDGGIRLIAPVRLPEHETVYALTVHKSQGSEFDELLLILPDRDAPVLTRELIYTAITRARKGIEIWSDEELFIRAVSRRIERSSGLRETLWDSKQTGVRVKGFDSP